MASDSGSESPGVEAAEAGATHCPHCGQVLPTPEAGSGVAESDVIFCPSCGRRVEGWRTGLRAALGRASAGAPLPGGDEPTRAITPSASLLSAIAASREANRRNAESPPQKRSALPLAVGGIGVLLTLVGVGAFVLRPPAVGPAVSEPEAKPPAVSPPVVPPVIATLPATPKKLPMARRISAPPIMTVAAVPIAKSATPPSAPPAAKTGKGPLPHKTARTDSRGAEVASLPTGTAAPAQVPSELPSVANETTENEAAPMTEADRRSEAAARADADSVRFVVRARLPQVHACYTRVFKEASPGGRVDVGFVIGPSGKATKIHTEANSTGSAALATCLEQRIGEWEFPRPASGQFELIYPFVFSPGT